MPGSRTSNDKLVSMILNLYSSQRKIPISLVLKDRTIRPSSDTYCSDFCKMIHKIKPHTCHQDHLSRADTNKPHLTMCHAGLWNYVIPIRQNGTIIGALSTGSTRLEEKDDISKKVLQNFKGNLSDENFSLLKSNFDSVPIIEKFDLASLENLKVIEERVYLLLSAQELEKRKVLNLAHEILLPMQSIIANAENLQRSLTRNKSEFAAQAEEIMHQILRLGLIVDNMRSNLLAIEHEKYRFEYLPIHELIQDVILIFKYEAMKKKIEFKADLDPYNLPIAKYPLNRALFNLIHNAIKYSYWGSNEQKRYVEIIGRKDTDKYSISISNFGIGILESEKDKIFTDGYRGRLSSDRERTGSGIGLSEAKRIIENHGGCIKIISNPTSEDIYGSPYITTVTIELPRDQYGKI